MKSNKIRMAIATVALTGVAIPMAATAAHAGGSSGGTQHRVAPNGHPVDPGVGPFYAGRVTTHGARLSVRTRPSSDAHRAYYVKNGEYVWATCWTVGSKVNGTQGLTNRWLRLGNSRWVSAAYVNGSWAHTPRCSM